MVLTNLFGSQIGDRKDFRNAALKYNKTEKNNLWNVLNMAKAMTKDKHNEKFDIVKAVEHMQKYWDTYDCQDRYEDYSEQMFLDDALYGIGVAMYKDKYRFANGYDKFKDFLGANFFKERLKRKTWRQ